MLIIFDLDDTLIDTTGVTISFKFWDVVDSLKENGLDLPREQIHEELIAIDKNSPAARTAFKEFLKRYDKEELYDKAVEAYTAPAKEGFPVALLSNAVELLDELGKEHTLAMVSAGKKELIILSQPPR